jgi:hypothetical protein
MITLRVRPPLCAKSMFVHTHHANMQGFIHRPRHGEYFFGSRSNHEEKSR